jgi:hypothetical protein
MTKNHNKKIMSFLTIVTFIFGVFGFFTVSTVNATGCASYCQCYDATPGWCSYDSTNGGNWQCHGPLGTEDDIYCHVDPPPPPSPVNGLCNNSTLWSCSIGSQGGWMPVPYTWDGITYYNTWSCAGSNGGATDYCYQSIPSVDGQCGDVNGLTRIKGSVEEASFGSDSTDSLSRCNLGTNLGVDHMTAVVSPSALSPKWTWNCAGNYGGSSSEQCTLNQQVDGICSETSNECVYGNPINISSNTWQCEGNLDFNGQTVNCPTGTTHADTTPAGTTPAVDTDLSGWAWSSTIGWISMSGNGYGIKINTDQTLSGYAWSDNIGWIQFGDLSDFPSGSGTDSENANLSGGDLKGWAKALSADGNGWDGWISLSGTGYGVTVNNTTGNFSGWAWGSDVVGWVDFSEVTKVSTSINGVCSYPLNSYTESINQALCSFGDPISIVITNITSTDSDGANYSQAWTCKGIGIGSSDQDCVLRTKYVAGYPVISTPINARLTPNIVNVGQTCSVSILDSNLSTIMASSTCSVYLDSNPPVSYPAGGDFVSPSGLPQVEPGKDYKVLCKDKNTDEVTHTSKILKCVLNPSVREI